MAKGRTIQMTVSDEDYRLIVWAADKNGVNLQKWLYRLAMAGVTRTRLWVTVDPNNTVDTPKGARTEW